MGHTVTIEGSGHTFDCEDGESILEAALRSGVTLRYGCNNGSCGDCEAVRVSGSTAPIRHSDYVTGSTARSQSSFLTCSHTATSNVVIAAAEPESAGDVPAQSILARPSRLEALDPDVTRLVVRTPRTQTLRFLAGQWVRLICEDGLSIGAHVASCPCNGMQLEFFIQASEHGLFHQRLNALSRKPAALTVEGPHGEYLFDDDGAGPLLFVASMEGFAACKSLIEHAFALDWPDPIHLIWSIDAEPPPLMRNLLRAWRDALDGFTYTLTRQHEVAVAAERVLATTLHDKQADVAEDARSPTTVFAAGFDDMHHWNLSGYAARLIPVPFPDT